MEVKGLEDLEIYQRALELSNLAWEVYRKIPKVFLFHIGNQFLDAMDSIGANIAEGFGRFHYKDSLRFYYYSRGSLFESKHWVYLLRTRAIIDEGTAANLMNSLNKEGVKLNNFIQTIKVKIPLNENF